MKKKNWFDCLTEKEQKLLTHRQKVELRKFDRKIDLGNRNWNKLTVPVGLNISNRNKSDCLTQPGSVSLDFILSQKYPFLQPLEREVVKLLVYKYKLTEIALMLGLSYCRVRGLRDRIRDKCGDVQ